MYTVLALSRFPTYRNRMSCQASITGPPNSTISLTFTAFDTESGYDFLYLYSGVGVSSLIGSYCAAQLLGITVDSASSVCRSTVVPLIHRCHCQGLVQAAKPLASRADMWRPPHPHLFPPLAQTQ
jgi:hypothetical protein